MLVLSRRANETIRFPQLGISVSIVSVKGSRVQVGIDAPPEIQVLRRELEVDSMKSLKSYHPKSPKEPGDSARPASESGKARHDAKNRLNTAMLGLHLAQKQLAAGQVESADKTLANALARLAELECTALVSPAATTQPNAAQVPVSENRQPAAQRRNVAASGNQTSIDVLLVEDDPNEQALLLGLLELEGYRVHVANNGIEALDCLKRVTPRFVLLDMMMPECDGRETFDRMRELPALENVPILAVSGASPDSVGLSIGNGGLDVWFPKPLNAPRLVRHLRERVVC